MLIWCLWTEKARLCLTKFIIFALEGRKHLLPLNDLLLFQPQAPCIFATYLRVIPACLNVITYADSQKTSALKYVVGLHCVVSESMGRLSISQESLLLGAPDFYTFWSWILEVLQINTVEWALHRRDGGRLSFRLVPKSRTWRLATNCFHFSTGRSNSGRSGFKKIHDFSNSPKARIQERQSSLPRL